MFISTSYSSQSSNPDETNAQFDLFTGISKTLGPWPTGGSAVIWFANLVGPPGRQLCKPKKLRGPRNSDYGADILPPAFAFFPSRPWPWKKASLSSSSPFSFSLAGRLSAPTNSGGISSETTPRRRLSCRSPSLPPIIVSNLPEKATYEGGGFEAETARFTMPVCRFSMISSPTGRYFLCFVTWILWSGSC